MTEAEIWELIRRSWEGVPLNETQKQIIREYLRNRMSPDTLRAFEKDVLNKPPSAPRPPWWKRLLTPKNLGRLGVYGALAYLLVAAANDSGVVQKPLTGGSGPCKPAAGSIALTQSSWASGPNGALKEALAALDAQCAAAPLNCAGGTCPTCAPDVAVQSVDVKTRIFWYTVDATAICQCWCP